MYIRFIIKKDRDWAIEPSSFAQLAEFFLDSRSGNCSVYKTAGDFVSEAKCVSAHYLTLRRSSSAPEKVFALRIPQIYISECELAISSNPGETGVGSVDSLHCEISGSQEKFEAIAGKIHNSLVSGEDLLRTVYKSQIQYQLREFLKPAESVSRDAKTFVLYALGEPV